MHARIYAIGNSSGRAGPEGVLGGQSHMILITKRAFIAYARDLALDEDPKK